jgi:hypothetical protein
LKAEKTQNGFTRTIPPPPILLVSTSIFMAVFIAAREGQNQNGTGSSRLVPFSKEFFAEYPISDNFQLVSPTSLDLSQNLP